MNREELEMTLREQRIGFPCTSSVKQPVPGILMAELAEAISCRSESSKC